MNNLQDGNKFLAALDCDSAIAVYTDIIDRRIAKKQYPSAGVYAQRGYALSFKEEKEDEIYKKAIEDCSKALALLPNHSRKRYRILRVRAYAYYLQGQYEKAVTDCTVIIQAITNTTSNPKTQAAARAQLAFVYELLGSIYLNRKQYSEAISNFRKALEIYRPGQVISQGIIEKYKEACKKFNNN
ncbi:MAG: tetratricopeptide repeat protein [Flavobacteriaceae bacterium]|jgi:tetratricopeptide (TPR) repeat protein|nr:tetratricopeptide repeat protein [Flavobacteriaceae bacterium]